MISLDQTTCRSWIKEMLQAAGTHQEAAHRAADIFVRSSLRQTGHHDISYLPQRLELLQRGTIIPAGKMELLFDTPAFSRWDGHGALGEYNCSLLLEKTMEKAKQLGLAMGTVRHSNHFLAGHPYGQIAAEKGCMAIVWSNTDPCMG
ncbi:MAG: Ldh family oxidoreductase, partial [Spirochaetaceae bacterium]|nr:Ldh family oxidoreductase [Spirochaetaceae bacterium]